MGQLNQTLVFSFLAIMLATMQCNGDPVGKTFCQRMPKERKLQTGATDPVPFCGTVVSIIFVKYQNSIAN